MSIKKKLFILLLFLLFSIFKLLLNDGISSDYKFGIAPYNNPSTPMTSKAHYYEEELPINLLITIGNYNENDLWKPKEIKDIEFGKNDWYKILKITFRPVEEYKEEENEKRKLIRLNGIAEDMKYKIINYENLLDGNLKPGEHKSLLIELVDIKVNYTYDVCAILMNKKDCERITVRKAVMPLQKRDLLWKNAIKAENEENYTLALDYYLKALNIEIIIDKETEKRFFYSEHMELQNKQLLLSNIYSVYWKNKDYINSKKYLLEVIKYFEKEERWQNDQYKYILENDEKLLSIKDPFERNKLIESIDRKHQSLLEIINDKKNKELKILYDLDALIKQQEKEGKEQHDE